MEAQPNYVIVGAFVVTLMVAALFFVLWMTKMDIDSKAASYDIFFEGSVTGLRVNEKVRYHGLPIGYVKSLAVDKSNPERIRVRVAISETSLIRQNTIASIEVQGLTGYSYIQIEGGSRDSPVLGISSKEPFPVINSKRSRIETLFTDAPKVLRRVYKLSGTLNKFFDDETRLAFKEVMFETRSSLKSLQKAFDQFNLQIDDMKKNVDLSLVKFRESADVFNGTAHEIKQLVQSNKDAIEGFTNTSLYEFSKLISEAQDSVRGISRVVKAVERSPGDFLNKNLNKGYSIE